MLLSRREFMQASAAGALAASALGKTPAFGAAGDDLLVIVHLRGGWDGLHVLAPAADELCGERDRSLCVGPRPTALRVLAYEQHWDWRLHPGAEALAPLFWEGSLAAFPRLGACRRPRGHLDARQRMARSIDRFDGWIAGALGSGASAYLAVCPGQPPLDVCGMPVSLLTASPCTLVVRNGMRENAVLDRAGAACDTGQHRVADLARRVLTRRAGPRVRPGLAWAFDGVCAALEGGLDVAVAVVEDGGWDTHASQGRVLDDKLPELARAVSDFWRELGRLNARERTRVMIVSEFGRTVGVGSEGGTDHGHAGLALVLGGAKSGVQGTWQALRRGQLVIDADPALAAAAPGWRGSVAEGLLNDGGLSSITRTLSGGCATGRGLA